MAMSLATVRFEQLLAVLTRSYTTHPDAAAFTLEYREVLARCMASKIVYGVTYDDDIEQALARINRWRA